MKDALASVIVVLHGRADCNVHPDFRRLYIVGNNGYRAQLHAWDQNRKHVTLRLVKRRYQHRQVSTARGTPAFVGVGKTDSNRDYGRNRGYDIDQVC